MLDCKDWLWIGEENVLEGLEVRFLGSFLQVNGRMFIECFLERRYETFGVMLFGVVGVLIRLDQIDCGLFDLITEV